MATMGLQHLKTPFVCKCGIRFTSERSLNFHRGSRACRLRDPNAARHQCPDCRFTSFYVKTMENHRLIRHSKEFPFECKCGLKFTKLDQLLNHQDHTECSQLHTCRICGHIAPTHGQLNRHSRSHSDIKPYLCECGRAYPRKDSYYRHQRSCKIRGMLASGGAGPHALGAGPGGLPKLRTGHGGDGAGGYASPPADARYAGADYGHLGYGKAGDAQTIPGIASVGGPGGHAGGAPLHGMLPSLTAAASVLDSPEHASPIPLRGAQQGGGLAPAPGSGQHGQQTLLAQQQAQQAQAQQQQQQSAQGQYASNFQSWAAAPAYLPPPGIPQASDPGSSYSAPLGRYSSMGVQMAAPFYGVPYASNVSHAGVPVGYSQHQGYAPLNVLPPTGQGVSGVTTQQGWIGQHAYE